METILKPTTKDGERTTKGFVQLGHDVEAIISSAHPALVSADGILPGTSFKLRLLVINLASVPGGQLVNSPIAQSLRRCVQLVRTPYIIKMANNRLYIIGNGFDLHHGLKSRYWDFRAYLVDKDNDLVEKLEEYFGDDALWSDFEETLSYLDTEQIIDECSNYLVSYGAEDWSDAYHHDYQYEVQKRIDIITEDLKKRFTEWILQLTLPADVTGKKISLKPNSSFINFNYTDTLQKLYGVTDINIFYIHNKAVDNNSTLILGHSRDPKTNKTLEEQYNDEDTDVRVAEGNQILNSYFEQTYKSTGTIIAENGHYFEELKDIKEIYVLGHSLSDVDLPYFQEIIKHIDKASVKWKVSIYNKKELLHHSEIFKLLDIDTKLVKFQRLNNIDTQQMSMFPEENK